MMDDGSGFGFFDIACLLQRREPAVESSGVRFGSWFASPLRKFPPRSRCRVDPRAEKGTTQTSSMRRDHPLTFLVTARGYVYIDTYCVLYYRRQLYFWRPTVSTWQPTVAISWRTNAVQNGPSDLEWCNGVCIIKRERLARATDLEIIAISPSFGVEIWWGWCG